MSPLRTWFVAWSVAILSVVVSSSAGCSRPIERERAGAIGTNIKGPEGRVHVDDGGSGGLPLLFVHSYAGSTKHWSAQLTYFRPTRRAVALDLRGHGKSERPKSGDYAVTSMADDISAVADSLQLPRFVLIGHSMGGAAAIAYAGAHPDRLAALVLVGTPGQSVPADAAQVMTAMKADYDKVNEGYWTKLLAGAQPNVEKQVRGDLKRIPRDDSLAMIGAIFAYDPLPALRVYQGPKLIIDTPHGEGPSALHNQVPEVPRRVIPGTSHWPQMDKPEEFNRMLAEFLANAS